LLEDDVVRGAVLLRLLDEYPAPLTIDELLREMAGPRRGFSEEDQLRQAVVDLERAGLLLQQGQLAMPTRAAVHFNWLRKVS
jgi:hypothetical protein